jgi:flavin-dependent dehydrogenase
MIHEVVIAGAGPAGCLAGIVLARRGVRVLMLDRAVFPRDKLCGDTLNPGALAVLRRLGIGAADEGLALHGMLVTGPNGARVIARYPGALTGRAILRRDLDFGLIRAAAEAGVQIEERCVVDGALRGEPRQAVRGVVARMASGRSVRIDAPVTIAADGRESRLARALGLARHPSRPRRWAAGAYFDGVAEVEARGEMHVRPGHYLGVAPVPGNLTNVCLVTADRTRLREPRAALIDALESDPALAARFSAARMVTRPVMLGPLAVECPVAGMPGLLLAGDTAGFIDPMTGDGLRFALRGAELAAQEALRALETGGADAYLRLTRARDREFRGKWRFNRVLRRLAGSPPAVRTAGYAARLSGWPVRRVIAFAGDVSAA